MSRITRRDLLRAGLYGAGLAAGVPALWRDAAWATPGDSSDRTLVVVELAGGNDGLNTIVPYRNDDYYKARPNIAVKREEALRIDDEFGFHPRLIGLHNLWSEGHAAIVHGCGYPNPIRSHFQALEYWHTGVPRGAEPLGWVGRLADARWPAGRRATIVNVAEQESLAVRSAAHSPIVFSNPALFARVGPKKGKPVYQEMVEETADDAPLKNVAFLRDIARTADRSSQLVRDVTSQYETPVAYGTEAASLARDLRNVAALLAADFPARLYYVGMSGFDTHGAQTDTQGNLLMYVGDALEGFLRDVARHGRADSVSVLVFTEFGRRVAENESGGTDHGTATPMWLLGENVRPGFHGTFPSLDDLDEGDLRMTTDFRRVYASVLEEWMGTSSPAVLRGPFEPLGLYRLG